MDTFAFQPVEAIKADEGAEAAQSQELDEATHEPASRVEQIGDYKQSEAIQTDFTAVVENVNTAHGNKNPLVHPGNTQQNAVVEMESGARDTVLGREPKPLEGVRLTQDYMEPMPPDHPAGVSEAALAGAEDRNTVLGRQPKAGEGPFGKNSDGGSEDGGDNITPINLPNIRDEALPARAQATPKTENGLLARIDPVTGQSTDSTGKGESVETESQGNPSATMRDAVPGRAFTRNTKGIGDDPPPQMEQSEGKAGSFRMPIDPEVSDGTTRVKNPGQFSGEESQSPVGPQELENQRFADQALDALGYGLIGYKTGTKGEPSGVGPKAPGKTKSGLSGVDVDYENDSHGTSGGSSPVHHYGNSIGEVDQREDDEDPPAGNNAPPGTDKGGVKGTGTKGEVTMYGNEKSGDGSTAEDRHKSVNPAASGTSITSFGTTYTVYKDANGNYLAFQRGNSVDGGSPMPYTGVWSAGKHNPKNPGTIGGKDSENDSGKLMPVLRNSGLGSQGGGGGNSTDGPSVWDDGKWYGGIFGGGGVYTDSGGALPIDPVPHDRV